MKYFDQWVKDHGGGDVGAAALETANADGIFGDSSDVAAAWIGQHRMRVGAANTARDFEMAKEVAAATVSQAKSSASQADSARQANDLARWAIAISIAAFLISVVALLVKP